MYARKNALGFISSSEIHFDLHEDGWVLDLDDESLKSALLSACDNDVIRIKNALQFLRDAKLLTYMADGLMNESCSLLYIDITGSGVGVIEGVMRTEQARTTYENTFNVKINLAENVNVESFIKGELGPLFSLFTAS